jgi:phosphonate transport system substrate-binding protein
VPPGVVLIQSTIESKRQEYIRKVMSEFPSASAQEVGYIPNAPIPNYKYMISVVQQVKPIASQLQSKPVQLFNKTI